MVLWGMSDALGIHVKLDSILAYVGSLPTRDDLAEIRTDLTELRGEVGTLRGEVGTLRGEVGTLRSAVMERIDGLDSAVAGLGADHIKSRAAIMDRIDRLQDVVTAQGADLIKTRADIMDRIDRMQNVLSLQHEEHIVDVGTLERVERMSKATREEVAGLAEIVTPMLRIIHTLRGQIDELFEAVRILKQGRAA